MHAHTHACMCKQNQTEKIVVEDISPGLFSCGLPAGSSVVGLSVNVSLFSWAELLLPRRPGERSAGEGSAPKGSLVNGHLLIQPVFCLIFSFTLILTVNLISWGQKPDVCKGNSSSVSIIKLHHHITLLVLLTWTL